MKYTVRKIKFQKCTGWPSQDFAFPATYLLWRPEGGTGEVVVGYLWKTVCVPVD